MGGPTFCVRTRDAETRGRLRAPEPLFVLDDGEASTRVRGRRVAAAPRKQNAANAQNRDLPERRSANDCGVEGPSAWASSPPRRSSSRRHLRRRGARKSREPSAPRRRALPPQSIFQELRVLRPLWPVRVPSPQHPRSVFRGSDAASQGQVHSGSFAFPRSRPRVGGGMFGLGCFFFWWCWLRCVGLGFFGVGVGVGWFCWLLWEWWWWGVLGGGEFWAWVVFGCLVVFFGSFSLFFFCLFISSLFFLVLFSVFSGCVLVGCYLSPRVRLTSVPPVCVPSLSLVLPPIASPVTPLEGPRPLRRRARTPVDPRKKPRPPPQGFRMGFSLPPSRL